MITGDNKPANINTHEIDLNNGGWILIGILIGIIVILLIVMLVRYLMSAKKIGDLQKLLKDEISDEERNIILTYRTLKIDDKDIVRNTLKSLSKHHTDTD